MYETLGTVRLKSGETVEAGVVRGPDEAWADRVEDLLSHKGEVWRWQNAECLRTDLGLDIGYYVLHRDGVPFANLLTATSRGVGHFGHVYTRPEDRRQGAASQLMGLQMEDFRGRGGRALYLGTGFDSPAYHIYHSHGFRSLEPDSGTMEYFRDDAAAFHASWFADGPVEVKGTGWAHWPATAPLFAADLPGTVRCAPMGLLGRQTTEGVWLELLHRDLGSVRVLEASDTGAIVGAAMCGRHPQWPQTALLDVYCHPSFWDWGTELIGALTLPAGRCLALSDDGCPQKAEVLAAAGFSSVARLPGRVAVDVRGTRLADVTEWER